MELIELKAVESTEERGVYRCRIEARIKDDVETIDDYISRSDDPYGLGPQVRKAVDQWIKDGKQIHDQHGKH